jgi:hypothetical protein
MAASYQTKPFSAWTLSDVQAAIQDAIAAGVGQAGFEANRRYVEDGDHWQEGATWPTTHPDAFIRARILASAAAIFCSVDSIGECVSRQVDALLDTEPALLFVPVKPAGQDGKPSDAQAAEAAAMLEALSGWWDRVDLWARVREAARCAAWAERGYLRHRFLPSAFRTAVRAVEGEEREVQELVGGLSFEDALERIHLSAPSPAAALVYVDPETQERASLITGVDEQDRPYAEVWYIDGAETVRRIVGGMGDVEERIPGARLPLGEIRGKLLVTESVRRQQGRLNYCETMLSRTVESAGFRERYTSNAEPFGVWSPNLPDGKPLDTYVDGSGKTWYLHPAPRAMGSGVLTELQGRIYTGKEGAETLATPEVTIVDPVDPDYIIKAAEHAEYTILHSCHQLHVLEGDKATSGYSKRQSRSDFEKHVRSYKGATERATRDTVEGAISDAALLTADGDPRRTFLERFRVQVNLHINTGPLAADEIEAESMLADKLLKPRADVQAAVGVEDGAAADAAILADPIQRLSLRAKQGEVLTSWGAATNLPAALEAAGVEAPLAESATRRDFPAEQ